MAKKEKRLCKWKEDEISEKFDKYITIVSDPKFVCKKMRQGGWQEKVVAQTLIIIISP